jgi:translation initiation factor 3 subunit G
MADEDSDVQDGAKENLEGSSGNDDATNVVLKEKTVKVNPRVAKRRHWKKFNDVASEPAGIPNPANTILKEEVNIQFVLADNLEQQENEPGAPGGMGRLGEPQVARDTSVHCRTCRGPHLTHTCPYKAQIESLSKKIASAEDAGDGELSELAGRQQRPGAYIPLGMRDAMQTDRRKMDEENTVRVNNLSENVTEDDLRDLFGRFGTIKRVFLARDKHTKVVRGFAYVTFESKPEAANAIHGINGFGFDHLILKVDWAKSDKRG